MAHYFPFTFASITDDVIAKYIRYLYHARRCSLFGTASCWLQWHIYFPNSYTPLSGAVTQSCDEVNIQRYFFLNASVQICQQYLFPTFLKIRDISPLSQEAVPLSYLSLFHFDLLLYYDVLNLFVMKSSSLSLREKAQQNAGEGMESSYQQAIESFSNQFPFPNIEIFEVH